MSAFVVVPVYNEATVLRGVVEELLSFYSQLVIVDDGSVDRSLDTLRGLPVITLRHLVNRGQGAALQTGIECAVRKGASIVVTFDGDGQHDPRDIERLLVPIQAGRADVALGSRFLSEGSNVPWLRKVVLKSGVLFTSLTTGLALTDTHNGLRAFSRRAAEMIHFSMDRMAHASELLDIVRREKLKYEEVPVNIRYTDYSLRKGQSVWDSVNVLRSLAERAFFR
jgi:glycosyltransferase involved in cell wall biosynthesis